MTPLARAFQCSQSVQNRLIYTFDPKDLPKDECHIFAFPYLCDEDLVLTYLEAFHFHPSSVNRPKFKCVKIELTVPENVNAENPDLKLYSFPLSFKEECQKVALQFSMVINPGIEARKMLLNPIAMSAIEEIEIVFPRQANLLFFDNLNPSHRGYPSEFINSNVSFMHALGNLLNL